MEQPREEPAFAIYQPLKIPIRFIGIGEAVNDFKASNPDEFVEALI